MPGFPLNNLFAWLYGILVGQVGTGVTVLDALPEGEPPLPMVVLGEYTESDDLETKGFEGIWNSTLAIHVFSFQRGWKQVTEIVDAVAGRIRFFIPTDPTGDYPDIGDSYYIVDARRDLFESLSEQHADGRILRHAVLRMRFVISRK